MYHWRYKCKKKGVHDTCHHASSLCMRLVKQLISQDGLEQAAPIISSASWYSVIQKAPADETRTSRQGQRDTVVIPLTYVPDLVKAVIAGARIPLKTKKALAGGTVPDQSYTE